MDTAIYNARRRRNALATVASYTATGIGLAGLAMILVVLFWQGFSGLSLAVFTEMTFHAAYEPQRAIRTDRWKYIRRFDGYDRPVLANCDDSATKDLLVSAGWGDQIVPREELHDLVLDPNEGRNLADDPAHRGVRAELAGRLEEWMEATDDPLLTGPVEPPPGAIVNRQDQVSPAEPAMPGWSSSTSPSRRSTPWPRSCSTRSSRARS